MKNLNISIDVGGTHTRIRADIIESNEIINTSREYKQKINSKIELEKFIKFTLNEINSNLKPHKCVIGFAGAVIDHREVTITNWKNQPTIDLGNIKEWGFPENGTIMVNDMELAGYGILDMEESNEKNSSQCEILFKPNIPAKNRINNKLIIAPGTGFGTASIIEFTSHTGVRVKDVLSSEIQHIQMPAFEERHVKIIEIILSKKTDRSFLNYEDIVSGKGLEDTYKAIQKIDGIINDVDRSASKIADLAVKGVDNSAIEALDLFYRCTGRIMQAMALMIQPYGGIYLCGASTINNASFILKSKLIEEFHNCLIRQQLLVQFPVYIFTKPDINIAGGLWACRNII